MSHITRRMVHWMGPPLLVVGLTHCAADSGQRLHHPDGYSQARMERDYLECDYKAKVATQEHFYSSSNPFPFGPGPQHPADHARALHGLSTMNALRETCLAAKGYRVE